MMTKTIERTAGWNMSWNRRRRPVEHTAKGVKINTRDEVYSFFLLCYAMLCHLIP